MTARLRPRFAMKVDLGDAEVMELFASRKAAGGHPCVMRLYNNQVEFSMRPADSHFWSPFLNLIVQATPEGSVLSGKYGPNVNVWTMFLAVYAACFLLGSAGVVFGLSQTNLGQPAWGFWLSVGCASVATVTYAIGRFGRMLAHPQMLIIHAFLEEEFRDHVIDLMDEETG